MESASVRFYEFGDFRLDVRRRILLRNGDQIALSSRIFDLLLVMLENEGQVLEHDALLDRVWDGAFVEQSNLKKSVSALRQILGEKPNESLYIKTVPRRGYSFVAPVNAVSDEPDEEILFRTTQAEIVVEQFEETEPATVKALPPASKGAISSKVLLGVAGAVLLISLAALGYWYFFSAKPVLFNVENVSVQRLTDDGTYFDSAVSPDGNYIVHASPGGEGIALNIHQIATGSTSQLVSYKDASFWAYAFTPDGNFIYYVAKNWAEPEKTGIYKVPFLGGESRLIYRSDGGGGITFTPDGKLLAFQHSDANLNPQIITMGLDGNDVKPIATFEAATRLWSIRFDPDGKRVLYCLRKSQPDDSVTYSIGEIDAATGEKTELIPDQERVIQGAVWLPDKSSLIFLVREPNAELRQLWQYFPGSKEWRRITNDNDTYRALNIVRNGTAIVATRESMVSSMWVGEGESLEMRQITSGINIYGHVGWTADDRLVYSSIDNSAEVMAIMNSAGKNKRQLTNGKDGIWMQPIVSADGRRITFISNRSGSTQLWRMGLDGENAAQVTNASSPVYDGKLLSDGQTAIFQRFTKPAGWQLFRQVGTGEATSITPLQISNWDVSPDERTVAVWVEDATTKKWSLVVMSIENGAILRTLPITTGDTEVRWTRDAKAVTYVVTKDDASEIRSLPADGSSEAKTILSVRGDPIIWFNWSLDGKKLVIIRGKRSADAVMIRTNEAK